MPDRVDRLREAAQARHEATLQRATAALQRMARRGEAVTFRRLAETAGVSRSWLYRQPQLREELTRLRDTSTGRRGNLPSAERAPVPDMLTPAYLVTAAARAAPRCRAGWSRSSWFSVRSRVISSR